jgi:hypothetical protein
MTPAPVPAGSPWVQELDGLGATLPQGASGMLTTQPPGEVRTLLQHVTPHAYPQHWRRVEPGRQAGADLSPASLGVACEAARADPRQRRGVWTFAAGHSGMTSLRSRCAGDDTRIPCDTIIRATPVAVVPEFSPWALWSSRLLRVRCFAYRRTPCVRKDLLCAYVVLYSASR